MVTLSSLFLIAAGLLVAADTIQQRVPAAKVIYEPIRPVQGWGGVFLILWSLWAALYSLGWIAVSPTAWAAIFIGNVLLAVMGVLLGYDLLGRFLLAKIKGGTDKVEPVHKRLVQWQSVLGLVAVGWGGNQLLFALAM